ncbi:hypothetical protein ABZS79_22720 [Streptomyces griseoloalbus]|uniref:hypothetical protein n=1 Tax=Streptomyces griseoloalbus TaxID=67303 RepID=UPI0033AA05C3
MNDSTQTELAEDTPTGYGFCSWHHRFAAGVRLIDVIEQGSGVGAGAVQYACGPCRQAHGLVPFADR